MKYLVLLVLLELSWAFRLQVIPGSSIVLPCFTSQRDFVGLPVTWKYNGIDISAEIPEAATVIKVIQDGHALSISPVSAAIQGMYVCTVQENDVEWINTYIVDVDASADYTLKVRPGLSADLPCYRPTSDQSKAYAHWYKETPLGPMPLSPVDGGKAGERVEWFSPDPSFGDQSITIKQLVVDDAGLYHCESTEKERFSTVHLIVEAAPTVTPLSCSAFPSAWEPCQDQASRSWAPVLEESLSDFSMELYSHLSRYQPSKNLLFSPISISTVLSHLLLGARGETRRDMEAALRLPHNFHCLHLQTRLLRERLNGSLQMGSQIYYNPLMNLSSSFANQSLHFYGAEPVRLLDDDERNAKMINGWVAQQTGNKITQLLDSVPSSTQLILLNAVSFTGQWKLKFEEQGMKAAFTKLNGDIVKVPVLHSSEYSVVTASIPELTAQVARFPLSGESSLYVVLPRSHALSDLQRVEERMSPATLRRMMERLAKSSPQVIEVTLPKIKLDIQADMNTLLRKLGLSSLFESANLCGLSEDQILLSDAQHRAFLALTENGVEAGAATSLSFSRSYSAFSALRPFILLLWSDRANVPLFVGRVTVP